MRLVCFFSYFIIFPYKTPKLYHGWYAIVYAVYISRRNGLYSIKAPAFCVLCILSVQCTMSGVFVYFSVERRKMDREGGWKSILYKIPILNAPWAIYGVCNGITVIPTYVQLG